MNSQSSLKSERKLVLTHDVDWPFKGPGKTHVLTRQERFTPEIIQKVKNEDFNPYFGVPKIREIEEKFGVRSTFFFRPIYDDGSKIDEYTQTIRDLVAHGWEVGLHANNTSTVENVKEEKGIIEKSIRINYLWLPYTLPKTLRKYIPQLSICGHKIRLLYFF